MIFLTVNYTFVSRNVVIQNRASEPWVKAAETSRQVSRSKERSSLEFLDHLPTRPHKRRQKRPREASLLAENKAWRHHYVRLDNVSERKSFARNLWRCRRQQPSHWKRLLLKVRPCHLERTPKLLWRLQVLPWRDAEARIYRCNILHVYIFFDSVCFLKTRH